MSGLKELVESLGGTALMGGILIQFSDTAFEQAVKKIYEMGAEAEREACAEIAEIAEPYKCADLIRARNAT